MSPVGPRLSPGKDGINGPDIDQLRKETTANINGAGDSHFEDPEFVKAAKDMHEAKLLAEGGVVPISVV